VSVALSLGLASAGALASSQTMTYALPAAVRITYEVPIFPAADETLYNFEAARIVYKPLLWIDRKIQVDYQRSVASSVTTKDGQHYTIHLNPKWHWSDGKPVTAQDLVFDFNLIRSIPESQNSKYGSWGIGGVPNNVRSFVATGPHTVKVTLDKAVSAQWFIYNGLAQLTPLPKQAWDKYPGQPAKTLSYLQAHGNDPQFIKNSPVDGPFTIQRFVNNQSYSFSANPKYDGHKPSYHTFVMRYFTTTDAEYNALRSGQVQVGYLPVHLYGQRHVPGYRFLPTPQYDISYIYVNFGNPAAPELKDLAVRKALQMAIDQPVQVKVLLHGYGVAQYGPVPYRPSTYLSPLLKHGFVPYPFNPALGKQLLLKDGYHLVNGVMTKGGHALDFTLQYTSGNALQQQQAELFASEAAKEGVKVSLEPKPFDTLIGELSSPKSWTLIYYGGWIYGLQPYPTNFGLFDSHGGSNQQSYADPVADQAIQNTHSFYKTKAEALSALYSYEEYLATHLPVLWMPSSDLLYEIASNVRGAAQHINPVGNISPQYWNYR
jgi:peptide/nickel transport system substrate-binding protein